ncbi:MAG: DUF4845 domain-containing protein [Gammaproteobacteria bacterium]
MQLHRRQRGMSFISLLFVGAIVAFAGVIVAQIIPTYLEYISVDKAVKKAATGTTVAEVRATFDKAAQIDDIRTISGKDLEVGKQGDKVIVRYSYTREIHVAGPAYIVMKYEGDSN